MPRHYYNINLRDFFCLLFCNTVGFFSCFLFFFGILCFECFLLNDIKCTFFIVSFVLQISAIELNGSLLFFLHSREQLNHTTCVLQSFFAHSRTHARVSQNLSKRCKITPSSNHPQQMTMKSQVASISCFFSRAAGKTWSRRPGRTDRQRSSPGTAGTSVPDRTMCRRTARRRCGCTPAEPVN